MGALVLLGVSQDRFERLKVGMDVAENRKTH
jgi:hypothetical protein